MTLIPELSRQLRTERTMVRVRWAGVAFGLLQVLTYYLPYPPNLRALALGLVGVLAVDAPPLTASVDGVQVERLLENLLANAVKHTPAGTSIWLQIFSQDGGVVITVEDDGPGVSDGLKEVIFEPFRQGDDPHPSGTGIGLSLVSKFAQLHGGESLGRGPPRWGRLL